MADRLTPAQRHRCMAAVRSKDTKPEMAVRRLVFGLGYRYRLHVRTLPGTPDIVFRRSRKVIFVHGCFWHGHRCRLGRTPTSNTDFWHGKLKNNRERDARTMARLWRDGWSVLVIWECEIADRDALTERLERFLSSGAQPTAQVREYEWDTSATWGAVAEDSET